MSTPVPDLVTLHLWRVPPVAIPRAMIRMARDRTAVRALRFGKLLGTASGKRFDARGTDLTRWALLASWDTALDAESFENSTIIRAWDALADERCRIRLRPIASRGRWSGRTPFGTPRPAPCAGPVAALTRARIRVPELARFWRAVPPVAADLSGRDGLLFGIGIGEAPVALQGTFSIWSSAVALRAFAHDGPAHAEVIRRTTSVHWYAEELFARFAVLGADGTLDGSPPAFRSP